MSYKTIHKTMMLTVLGLTTSLAYGGERHWSPLEPVSVKSRIAFFQNLSKDQDHHVNSPRLERNPQASRESQVKASELQVSRPIQEKVGEVSAHGIETVQPACKTLEPILPALAQPNDPNLGMGGSGETLKLSEKLDLMLKQFKTFCEDKHDLAQSSVQTTLSPAPLKGVLPKLKLTERVNHTIRLAKAANQLLTSMPDSSMKVERQKEPQPEPVVLGKGSEGKIEEYAQVTKPAGNQKYVGLLTNNSQQDQKQDLYDQVMDTEGFPKALVVTAEKLMKDIDLLKKQQQKNLKNLPLLGVTNTQIGGLERRLKDVLKPDILDFPQPAPWNIQWTDIPSKFFKAPLERESNEDLLPWEDDGISLDFD